MSTPSVKMQSLTRALSLSLLFVMLVACKNAEDQEAKRRLFEPPPPKKVVQQAQASLDVERLDEDAESWKKVNRMSFHEIALRAKSLRYEASGQMDFNRADLSLQSSEKVIIVQSDTGDFSINMETGGGSRQELAYVNDVFFLKNNNGKWRASRDPTGERDAYRDDGGGIWKSFFDLFSHQMKVKKMGERTVNGRDTVLYAVSADDETQKMTGGDDPDDIPVFTDGGLLVSDEDEPQAGQPQPNQMAKRISKWRQKAHVKSGNGEVWVDLETGVPLKVTFKGELHVDDSLRPAKLTVDFNSAITDLGKKLEVPPPAEAVEEIVRKKWPVRPRKVLEQAGVLQKLESLDEEKAKKPGTEKEAAAGK